MSTLIPIYNRLFRSWETVPWPGINRPSW